MLTKQEAGQRGFDPHLPGSKFCGQLQPGLAGSKKPHPKGPGVAEIAEAMVEQKMHGFVSQSYDYAFALTFLAKDKDAYRAVLHEKALGPGTPLRKII